jgi:hypothetical protein
VLGDAARELPLHAVGPDGEPVELIAGVATVADSGVLTLDGRLVRPRTPGATWVRVDVGECVTRIAAHVEERVDTSTALQPFQQFATPVRMVPGEIRSWRVAPGMYRLELLPAHPGDSALLLTASRTNCAPEIRVPQVYYCLARPGASVIVSHPGRVGNGLASDAQLRVHRLDVPSAYDPPGIRYSPRRPMPPHAAPGRAHGGRADGREARVQAAASRRERHAPRRRCGSRRRARPDAGEVTEGVRRERSAVVREAAIEACVARRGRFSDPAGARQPR